MILTRIINELKLLRERFLGSMIFTQYHYQPNDSLLITKIKSISYRWGLEDTILTSSVAIFYILSNGKSWHKFSDMTYTPPVCYSYQKCFIISESICEETIVKMQIERSSVKRLLFKKINVKTFPAVQWLRLRFHCRGLGFDPW